MNLWIARKDAEKALSNQMATEGRLLDRAFQQTEYLAQRLYTLEPATPLSRVTALVTAKARNLAQACYSLTLDGLAQESGATARVWLESIELLTYLRLAPEKAEEALHGKLPSAGERAKKIGSSVGNLRKFWNETASHMGFEWDTWRHLIDARSGKLRTRQVFKPKVLHGNLGFVFAMMTWTIRESAFCLDAVQGFLEEGIARQLDGLKDEGFKVFHTYDSTTEIGS